MEPVGAKWRHTEPGADSLPLSAPRGTTQETTMFQMLENLTSRLNRRPATPGMTTHAAHAPTDNATLDELEARFFAGKSL